MYYIGYVINDEFTIILTTQSERYANMVVDLINHNSGIKMLYLDNNEINDYSLSIETA